MSVRHNIPVVVRRFGQLAEQAQPNLAQELHTLAGRVQAELRITAPHITWHLANSWSVVATTDGVRVYNPARYSGHVHDGRYALEAIALVRRMLQAHRAQMAQAVTP